MSLFSFLISQNWTFDFLVWITRHYIEIIATLTGFLYLLYSIEGKKQLWFYGLITSGLYVYVCLIAGIYADMGINIYYVIISIYGWIIWSSPSKETKKERPITHTSQKEGVLILIITAALFSFIAFILKVYTDSTIPFWDAFTTSASITATWMLARKKIEHWLIWIVVDAISVGLYIYKGLYPTSILFFVYTILAFVGYIEWKKKCQVQAQTL